MKVKKNCLGILRGIRIIPPSSTFQTALSNALRYFPKEQHALLAPEFAAELRDYGHIYMYRLLPNMPLRWEKHCQSFPC